MDQSKKDAVIKTANDLIFAIGVELKHHERGRSESPNGPSDKELIGRMNANQLNELIAELRSAVVAVRNDKPEPIIVWKDEAGFLKGNITFHSHATEVRQDGVLIGHMAQGETHRVFVPMPNVEVLITSSSAFNQD